MAGPFQPTAPKRRKRNVNCRPESEPSPERLPVVQGPIKKATASDILSVPETRTGPAAAVIAHAEFTQNLQNEEGNASRQIAQKAVLAPPPPDDSGRHVQIEQRPLLTLEVQMHPTGKLPLDPKRQKQSSKLQPVSHSGIEKMPWFVLQHNSEPLFRRELDHDGRRLFNLLAFLHKNQHDVFKGFSKRCWNVYSTEYSTPKGSPGLEMASEDPRSLLAPLTGHSDPVNSHPDATSHGTSSRKCQDARVFQGPVVQPSLISDTRDARASGNRNTRVDGNGKQNLNSGALLGNGAVRSRAPAGHHSFSNITVYGPMISIRNELRRTVEIKLSQVLPTNWRNSVPLKYFGTEQAYEILEQHGEHPAALLPHEIVRPFEALQLKGGGVALEHAEVIRFLWVNLVRKPQGGAVLSGAMGSVRIHQVLTFSAMFSRVQVPAPRILVVVNRHEEWKFALELYRIRPQGLILPDPPQTVSEILSKWQQHGGLLICSDELYFAAISHKDSSTSDLARRALCRPGPDIIVLDEASRLLSMAPRVYRMLRRTETAARLAITSVSLAGNLENMWRALDWATPGLLGDLEEFEKVYVRKIANGHKTNVLSGKQAYRAAVHLAELVSPVLFPAFGSYALNKLNKRRIQFDSITLYTNLMGNQIRMYQIAARFLSKRVNRQQMSSFVAAHALQVLATSINGFEKLLESGADQFTRCASSFRLQRPLERVQFIFKELMSVVSRYFGNDESPKLHIAVAMYQYCMKRGEKILMFANSMEAQGALHERLKRNNPPGAQIFNMDLNASFEARSRHLSQFREWRRSAVLIAPYGPTAECRESAGWADLKVSRVLILDPGWNTVSEAQCLKRIVSPFSTDSVHRVQVIHLPSAGTIEQTMYQTTMRKYENEVGRLMLAEQSATPCHEICDRAYLVCPEIPEEWITHEYDDTSIEEQPVVIDNDVVTKEILDDDDGLINQLLNVRLHQQKYAVREVTCRRDRCATVANLADICTTVPLNNVDKSIAINEADCETRAHFGVSSAVMAGMESRISYESGSPLDMGVVDLIRPQDRTERKTFVRPGYQSSACTLAACWEPYFDLYEKELEMALNERDCNFGRGSATANKT